jgi:hypothetical protein
VLLKNTGQNGRNIRNRPDAEVAELVDALASGASELFARGGSSPLLGTIILNRSQAYEHLKKSNQFSRTETLCAQRIK